MDKNTDQTNFWLGWKATCAAQDCANPKRLLQACGGDLEAVGIVPADAEATAELAKAVISAMNASFRQALAYFDGLYGHRRVSEYADEVCHWSGEHPEDGCAFQIVEGSLYAKKTILGQPFKDYLFEDVAVREGGMGKNLYGYLKKVAWTCATMSFPEEERLPELINDDGQPMEADVRDPNSLPPDLQADIRLVEKFLAQYFDGKKRDGTWDSDHWISLYCVFHDLKPLSAAVVALCRRKTSALAVVRAKAVASLASALQDDVQVSNRAIRLALTTHGAEILDARMKDMPFFPDLEAILASKTEKNAGKTENAHPGNL